jgi:hypothetical protein
MLGLVKRLMVTCIVGSIGVLVGVLIAPARGADTRAQLSLIVEERMEDLQQTVGRGQQAVESAFASFRESARSGMDKVGGD